MFLRRPRRSVTICREGWAFLFMLAVVLAGAILRDINLMIIIAGLMAGMFLFNLVAAGISLRGVNIERTAPKTVTEGDLVVVELTLTHRGGWFAAWMVVAADTLRRRKPGDRRDAVTATVVFARVAPGGTRRATYRGQLTQRGEYEWGPLRIWCRFPLGLVRWSRIVESSAVVTVLPRRGRMTPRWRTMTRDMFSAGERTRRHGALEGEFHALRDWRSGDSRRWIHWRTSARRGELIVRQFEQPLRHDLAIVLDLWRPSADRGSDAVVERAVRVAATLVADAGQFRGGRLAVAAATGGSLWVHGPVSAASAREALAGLAIVEPPHDDRLVPSLQALLPKLQPGTLLVVVGTRPVDLSSDRVRAALSRDDLLWLDGMKATCIDVRHDALNDIFVEEQAPAAASIRPA